MRFSITTCTLHFSWSPPFIFHFSTLDAANQYIRNNSLSKVICTDELYHPDSQISRVCCLQLQVIQNLSRLLAMWRIGTLKANVTGEAVAITCCFFQWIVRNQWELGKRQPDILSSIFKRKRWQLLWINIHRVKTCLLFFIFL